LFDAAKLSEDVSCSLRTFLEGIETPLAVRSSSLFEDAFMQPFAGIYESVMLPNNPSVPLDERVEQLKWAVKRVYASTYSQQARRYAESMQNRTEEEKMAVILQPVVGSADVEGQYYYPALGGVANSVDFYPRPNTSQLNGCASVGLGLGASVVDGMPAVHFSLGDTTALSGPSPITLPVMALDLNANPRTKSCVITLPDAAEKALTILPKPSEMHMAPQAATTVPLTTDVHGEKVVFLKSYGEVKQASSKSESPELQTVALPQLLSGEVPMAKALSFLLRLGSMGLGCPVEIEFALKARKTSDERHQLHLLQIRPQAQMHQTQADHFRFLPSAQYAAVASERALGHGRFEGISDVVYVSPDRFDTANTTEIAREISEINASLQAQGRKYLLMAPGRWGSADAAKGIPVAWNDISNSAVIVETTLDDQVPLSQGSHFFQNIISFGLGYMTVDPQCDKHNEVADYAYWDGMDPSSHDTQFVRHVQLDGPLEIVVDGQSRHGVVMKPGKAFDVYVSQVDAYMALAQEQYSSTS